MSVMATNTVTIDTDGCEGTAKALHQSTLTRFALFAQLHHLGLGTLGAQFVGTTMYREAPQSQTTPLLFCVQISCPNGFSKLPKSTQDFSLPLCSMRSKTNPQRSSTLTSTPLLRQTHMLLALRHHLLVPRVYGLSGPCSSQFLSVRTPSALLCSSRAF